MTEPPDTPLRRGWTTGACAAAAARAAYSALLDGGFPDPVTITLPGGQRPSFALARHRLDGDVAEAAVVKDAGDDPDVTHGAVVVARVRRGATGSGIRYRAGDGVGTVTRAGLPLAVGEPAITEAPRRIIAAALGEVAGSHGIAADAEIEISIPGGAALARRTMNGRLGIVGGLSILGTTGVVIPYSCSAWIHSIHRGIDVARAAGLTHVAASTGSTSERAVQALYGLPEEALIDMGDFAGGTLKYLRDHPLPTLTIAGGFAKLSKLAAGLLDLHSKRGSIDLDWLAGRVAAADAVGLADAIRNSGSAGAALEAARTASFPLADLVADAARAVAREHLGPETEVEVLIFDRTGALAGRSRG